MAKFDLKGMLSERSTQEMDLPEQKTVYRNPEDLIPSKDNFYSTEDTEKLKQSIKVLGILQPLLIEERDGKDYILAGHSRRKCCLELIEEGMDRFRKVPCVYKPKIELSTASEEDEIIRKIIIIQSNTYREKTDWEKMTEALQMEELVKELREKTDLEGKTREIVSDLIGVSSTQIGRYHSISNNLSERLADAFRQNKLNISTAAELAGLNEKYQTKACELLENAGQLALNDAKLLKAQQEQERNIPGQLTIEQALHPHKPEEVNTVIPVDIQIDRFYESLRKNIETYVRKSDLNMTTYMLSALYGTVRVRNGHLNYQGSKEGIIFNAGSDQEELISWTDFSKKLIEKYGKKQKPVRMVAVDEPEEKGPAKCITGKSQSGICGAAAYCDTAHKCCAQCPDDCNIRCGWLEERCQAAAGVPDNQQQDDFAEATKIEEHIVENNKMSDHAGDIAEMVSADSSETSIQPPLPVMKNNDQRKEWLRKYKEWGLWYTDEHIGARYYKYDFENGTRLIVEEYDPEPVHNSPWVSNEPYYMHLVGGPEPERNNGIPKWTYHSKYNKYPNSETELVEFLKGVQK
ncbi:ParB N-terminal domain-containing protein [Blautia sp. 2744]|uniref:ParB N-terminal domain-containing protein n=1 Tax=Blautia intestinalis TaxID=2763028 RepID=A0ABR7HZ82_9FIRM|nr:ParB/RepB/Spo0J family partition protein [Blautia intestinalis]MBC5739525.1 ParB N-terminal domain-containing protein [Blautia intestinalis]